jgi:predicted transcriptional regulator
MRRDDRVFRAPTLAAGCNLVRDTAMVSFGMAMTLRLTEEETEALRRTAEAEHRSMQDVARNAIAEYTQNHRALRDRLLDRIFTEDENLLKRLAE